MELRVSLKAMERARSTLEDFCRSYFMFHGLDCRSAQHIFMQLPILMFVESYIYQLDEQNEELINASTGDVLADPFLGLRKELAARDLLTDRIAKELEDGVEYWRLERALCTACGSEIAVSDIMRAMHLKSFDYRVLNLLLYRLMGKEVNEGHFAFLAVSELLVEISDDLFDYEEDVVRNSFNILRLLLKVYGPRNAPVILAKSISEAEEKYQKLQAELDPDLAAAYVQRCEEAVREGGSKSKHVLGSWTIPPLILDENAFRAQVTECESVP